MADQTLGPAASEFLLYTAPSGAVRVHVLVKDDTVWLPQKSLSELFAVTVPTISRHLKNIFESSELNENSVVTLFETTAADGKTYQTRFYNLDAIIAVGYRVNSYEATQFRIWASRSVGAGFIPARRRFGSCPANGTRRRSPTTCSRAASLRGERARGSRRCIAPQLRSTRHFAAHGRKSSVATVDAQPRTVPPGVSCRR